MCNFVSWLFGTSVNEKRDVLNSTSSQGQFICYKIHSPKPKVGGAEDKDLSRQASLDGLQLNEAKCKELRIGFSNSNHDFEPLVLNGKPLELVTSPNC